jgi:hypothetical protein
MSTTPDGERNNEGMQGNNNGDDDVGVVFHWFLVPRRQLTLLSQNYEQK